MSVITKIHAREILDSRGNPTIEAEVVTADGARGRAACAMCCRMPRIFASGRNNGGAN